MNLHLAKMLRYLDTLEARLLAISVAALANDLDDLTDARKNLELLAKSGSDHTRNAARAALERFERAA